MLLVGSAVVGDGARFKEITLPSLERALDRDDVILSSTGDTRGIAAVYNEFIGEARRNPECEALILLHDDVEVVDRNFRAKVLAAVGEDAVGAVGVVGGADLRSIAWWEARRTAGRVFETRGSRELGPPRADVDVVDGLFLAISPRAFTSFMFDERACPWFHGYDLDFCLQARAGRLRVTVRPIELLHRTKGGYGDRAAFDETARALTAKWPEYIHPATRLERARRLPMTLPASLRTRGRRLRRLLNASRPRTAPATDTVPTEPGAPSVPVPADRVCLACGEALSPRSYRPVAGAQAIVCGVCGSGLTWPPPDRAVEGEGLWAEMYGNSRLTRRQTWFEEARKRLQWIQLYRPEGCLLEVGCGTGEFVKVAEQEGYDAFGVEPSEWAARHACGLDVPVETGFLSDWIARYAGLRPDGVCLWHVLEHVPAPLELLREVAAILAPGGHLFLEVPNFASSAAARLGMAWEGAQPADHFAHYTPDGLALLLGRAGFEQVQLLPIARRIYEPAKSWRQERNTALLHRHDWPPLDLLRGVARAPGPAVAGE